MALTVTTGSESKIEAIQAALVEAISSGNAGGAPLMTVDVPGGGGTFGFTVDIREGATFADTPLMACTDRDAPAYFELRIVDEDSARLDIVSDGAVVASATVSRSGAFEEDNFTGLAATVFHVGGTTEYSLCLYDAGSTDVDSGSVASAAIGGSYRIGGARDGSAFGPSHGLLSHVWGNDYATASAINGASGWGSLWQLLLEDYYTGDVEGAYQLDETFTPATFAAGDLSWLGDPDRVVVGHYPGPPTSGGFVAIAPGDVSTIQGEDMHRWTYRVTTIVQGWAPAAGGDQAGKIAAGYALHSGILAASHASMVTPSTRAPAMRAASVRDVQIGSTVLSGEIVHDAWAGWGYVELSLSYTIDGDPGEI